MGRVHELLFKHRSNVEIELRERMPIMYTVGKLAKQFNLSRSTLLYYDKIGLLSPSERSMSNYRLYSEKDIEKLRLIIQHRETGIPLEDIGKLFNIEENDVTEILSSRLRSIQEDIKILKRQEHMILSVLIDEVKIGKEKIFNRETWTAFLIKSGFSHEDLFEWHRAFEIASPREHKEFLLALGMTEKEISELRSTL